ncbi:hypothetical protein COOONC_28545 [Cooperia oncophora]
MRVVQTSLIPELAPGNKYTGITRLFNADHGKRQWNFRSSQKTTNENIKADAELFDCPPSRAFDTYFISNGEETEIWKGRNPLLFECASSQRAKNVYCSVIHNCICQPAELQILCNCMDNSITALFEKQHENRLPVRQPWVFFDKSRRDPSSVSALIPTLITAELLVTVKEDINMITKEVSNMTCKIGNAMAQGCYQ